MKKEILIALLLLPALAFCPIKAQKNLLQQGQPQITFTMMEHDFGDFAYGDIVYTKFPFRNTGSAPLVISGVERPCGCLLPIWPKNPIMPGDTGSIGVFYNSKMRPGIFRKTMVIYTNIPTKDDIIILVKGNANKKIKRKKR